MASLLQGWAMHDLNMYLVKIQNGTYKMNEAKDRIKKRLENRNPEEEKEYLNFMIQLIENERCRLNEENDPGYQKSLNGLESINVICVSLLDQNG